MKDKIYEKVKRYVGFHQMINPGDYVVAGISGGADSVCMLYLLMRLKEELPFRLAVVHVNHGLREEAWEDAAFVEELCQKWELPFFLQEVDMQGYAQENKLSCEEAGRLLRYQAFAKVLEKTEAKETGKIAVAHNQDDRAETMLFHMFRGSGLKGMGSIRPVRESVIRPLLCLERVEIEAYLREKGLTWQEDATNAGDVYARNRIRHHILSYAREEICGKAVSHMGELADNLAETEAYLQRETNRLYDRYVEENPEKEIDGIGESNVAKGADHIAGAIKIRLAGFKEEDTVMRKRVFLRALERLTPYRKDITARHLEALMELIEKDGSKELFLPYGIKALKTYDNLLLRQTAAEAQKEPGNADKSADFLNGFPEIAVKVAQYPSGSPLTIAVPHTGRMVFVLWGTDFLQSAPSFFEKKQNIVENRYTEWFDYDKITTSLLLRTRRPGDYFAIDDDLHTQTLKQYMINKKIPKVKRSEMYLLADGSHILWIPGYRASRQYKVEKSTRRILEVRLKGGDNGGTNRGFVD